MAIDTLVTIEQVKSSPPSGPGMAFRGFWKGVKGLAELIFSSPTAMIGLVIVIVWVLIAALAPIITTHDPLSQDYMQVDKGPSAAHPLGTDDLGRDVWSRVAFGARTILTLGPLSVLVAFVLGVALGLPAGYYQGAIDEVVIRVLNSPWHFRPSCST